RPLTLVLSGSEVATMEHLTTGSQPLFGRFALRLKIPPLDYFDAAQMTQNRSLREAATLYGALGGMPRYLAAIDPTETVAETLTRTLLLPSGEIYLQIEHLIEQEQRIRNPAEYQAVLATVAAGATRVSEIAQKSGLDEYATRRILEILERLELIWRERNFAAPSRAPYQHRIADNAVRFWYHFVNPNRSRLATGDSVTVWKERVEPFLNTYVGKVFEAMCEASYRRFHQRWGLSEATIWERWEGQDRNRRSIEIDSVARLADGRILTGEIKWSSQPVDDDVHRDLRRDLEDLSRSGQGWAHEALVGPRIYFSAAGFTERFRALAEEDGTIHLITLADMYAVIPPR
ncbi:MAG: hypothetical protein M3008_14250, partial [Chloroflexota bacterium]|nr:hypothetical protein [Chloroflexota bacterium]